MKLKLALIVVDAKEFASLSALDGILSLREIKDMNE